MSQPKILTILRHENSLIVVREFAEKHGLESISVALDPVELPDQVPHALQAIQDALPHCAAVVMGTKVFDPVKDGPSHLQEFLQKLQAWGVGQTPLCLTHLHDMPDDMAAMLEQTGLCVTWVDNDNLKRDGMNNLGPLILNAVQAV